MKSVILLCVLLLLEFVFSATFSVSPVSSASTGIVEVVGGVQCRFCSIDCMESTLFSSCENRYYQYGCHINHYCLSTKTATAREFFAGVALCIMKNGCKLKDSITTEEQYLQQTAEGRLELTIRDFVKKNMKNVPQTTTGMFELEKQVYELYQSQITKLEKEYAQKEAIDLLTQGKREALRIMSVSPTFFVLYDLMNTMMNEKNKWMGILNSIRYTLPQTSAVSFLQAPKIQEKNTRKAQQLLESCKNFAHITPANFVEQLKNTNNYPKAQETIVYYYIFRYFCKLPSSFLASSLMANEIVDESGKWIYETLYTDATLPWSCIDVFDPSSGIPSTTYGFPNPSYTRINMLFEGIQSYAFNYVKIVGAFSFDGNCVKMDTDALIENDKKLWAIASMCTSSYCTYSCNDHVSDSATQICDGTPEGVYVYKTLGTKACGVFGTSGDVTPSRWAAKTYGIFCQGKSRTQLQTQTMCFINALAKTTDQFAAKYSKPGLIAVMRAGAEVNKEEADFFWPLLTYCYQTYGGGDIKVPQAVLDEVDRMALFRQLPLPPTFENNYAKMLSLLKKNQRWNNYKGK